MNTQTLTNPATILNCFVVSPDKTFATEQPICASSCDYGFDFDEEELAAELLTRFSASQLSQADTDEIELRDLCFFS